MGTVGVCNTGLVFCASSTIKSCCLSSVRIVGSSIGVSRKQVLEQVDKELNNGDEKSALSLVKDLQGKPGGLRCFGAARQVPQRLYTLDELKLNGIEAASLLSPTDATLGAIENNLRIAAIAAGVAAWNAFGFNPQQILYFSLATLFLWTWDLIAFSGGIGSLVLDTVGHTLSQKYHNRVIQHEAGHFLIAYLVGILPKGYTLSSWEALQKEGSLNVQAGTAFVDFEFLEELLKHGYTYCLLYANYTVEEATEKTLIELNHMMNDNGVGSLCRIDSGVSSVSFHDVQVNQGKVTATTLNRFSCIALAGVATEYLLYGYAEGGLDDLNKLDALLKGLGFTQKKADSQVRWSVLNTILILRRHKAARSKLAEAMTAGKSVGSCIEVIEDNINDADI